MLRAAVMSLLATAFLCAPVFAQEDAAKPSIRDLDRLIGVWTFIDESTEDASYEYHEEGRRVCEYALDEEYIHCESRGATDASERTYSWYINYNAIDQKFEMIALFGNFPRKLYYSVKVSEEGRRIDLIGDDPLYNDPERSWGVITFDGDDKFVWRSYLNTPADNPDIWRNTFVERAQREE